MSAPTASPTAPALGKGRTVLPSPPGGQHDDDARRFHARASRWQRRRQLQRITGIGRVRRCGLERDPEAGSTLVISEYAEGRRAGFEGLVTCGSVHTCPVCAAKIAAKRAEELAQVLDAVHARGGSAFMLTLTIRHSAGDRLGLTKDERERRYVLDRRRRWRNRLDKIDARRMDRETAEAKGWDVDDHQADTDDIDEGSIRKQITRSDPEFIAVGPAAREQRDGDTRELAELNDQRGCWDAVTDAWAAATSGRDWANGQDEAGLLGWVRVTEVTDGGTPAILAGLPDGHRYSGNGWHVHVHVLLCFADDLSEDYVATKLGAGMHARWARKARQLGFDSSAEHGWDLRKAHRGDGHDLHSYFVKQAHEVTGGHRKEGRRRGGRTPMQLLADAVETYRVEDLSRWWVYEAVAEGRHQLEWSRGDRSLRTIADLGVSLTDEEIAEETLDGEHRLGLPPDSCHWIRTNGQHPALLDAAERGGIEGARAWLVCRGLALIGPDEETTGGAWPRSSSRCGCEGEQGPGPHDEGSVDLVNGRRPASGGDFASCWKSVDQTGGAATTFR